SDICSSFFFFQAEDGIRDRTVTGVQTCALPISGENGRSGSVGIAVRQAADRGRHPRRQSVFHYSAGPPAAALSCSRAAMTTAARSEERRVGKEWRSACVALRDNRTGAHETLAPA